MNLDDAVFDNGHSQAPNRLVPKLKSSELHVYIVVRIYCRENRPGEPAGKCYASAKSIGRQADGLGEKQTRRILDILVEKGHLVEIPDPSKATHRFYRVADQIARAKRPPRTPMSSRPDTHVQSTGHPRPVDRTPTSGPPVTHVRAPGHPCPGDRTSMSGKEEGKELRSFPSVVSPSADATGAPTSGGPTRTTPDSAPPPPADPADVFAGEIALTLGLGKSPEAGAWVRARLQELPGGLQPENIRTAVSCVVADCLERGVKVQWAMIRTRLSAMGGEHRRAKEAEEAALKAAAPSRQAEALRKANDHAALRGVEIPAAKPLVPQEAL